MDNLFYSNNAFFFNNNCIWIKIAYSMCIICIIGSGVIKFIFHAPRKFTKREVCSAVSAEEDHFLTNFKGEIPQIKLTN